MQYSRKRLLSLLVPMVMAQAHAQEVVNLGVLTVDVASAVPQAPQAVTLTQDELTAELVSDNKDLVRYNTEVSLAEDGRFGLGGLAMQGVDENRVAVTVDGMGVPNIEKQSALYDNYGWMYGRRVMLDPELAGKVTLKAGGDALSFGSGALGGVVSYQTKDPKDLVKDSGLGGYVKAGYNSRNSEKLHSVGVAGVSDGLDFLVNYSKKQGHETKNHANPSHDDGQFVINYEPSSSNQNLLLLKPNHNVGAAATTPDAMRTDSESVLAKLHYKPDSNHRIGLSVLSQKNKTKTAQASYNAPAETAGQKMYIADDQGDWQKYGLSYEYTPKAAPITKARVNFDHQNHKGLATTYQYRADLNATSTSTLQFNKIKIRPSTEKSDQITVGLDFVPVTLLGEHTFSVGAGLSKKDATNEVLDERICRHKTTDNRGRDIKQRWCFGEETYREWTTVTMPSIKTRTAYVAINDSIKMTDRLGAELGVRYDDYRYTPYFSDAQKILLEKGASKGLAYGTLVSEQPDAEQAKFQALYDAKGEVKAKNVGFGAKLDYQIHPDWHVQGSVATGFMMPTNSQLYGVVQNTFVNAMVPGFAVGLRPERSLTKNLAIQGRMQDLQLRVSGYHTKYKDLIEYNFADYQYLNVPSAQSYGGTVALDYRLPLHTEGRWSVMASYTKEKSKTFNGGNLLATQPDRALVGLDYVTGKGDFNVHARASWQDRKRHQDASFKTVTGQEPDKQSDGKFPLLEHSRPYAVFDVFATKRLGDRLELSAGVYNLFNKKYHTWDNLRSVTQIRNSGTDTVDKELVGLERYTAPGRNWAVSANYRF